LQKLILLLILIPFTISSTYSKNKIKIPIGSKIKADGIIENNEWIDAYQCNIDMNNYGEAKVYIKHDTDVLNFLYLFNIENKSTLCFPEIYIDPELNIGTQWQSDDWWFHVSGTDCSSKGIPDNYDNCRVTQNDWTANPNFAMGNEAVPLFEFEISIPLNKIGISTDKSFGMALAGALFWTESGKNNERKSLFPGNGITEIPSSWGIWELEKVDTPYLNNFFKKLQCFILDSATVIQAESVTDFINSNINKKSVTSERLGEEGIKLLRTGKLKEAITLHEAITKIFPESWIAFNSLGDAYWTIDKRNKAINAYKIALELSPDNPVIIANIQYLETEIYEIENETPEKFKYSPGQNIDIKGNYFGLTPPSENPVPFAPGIISTKGNMEFAITFSPNGDRLYFTRRTGNNGNRLMMSRQIKGSWTAPEVAVIAKEYFNNEPHITYDGSRMYYGSLRSIDITQAPNSFYTWYVDKAEDGWSEPHFFGPGMFVSTSKNKNLYTTDISNFCGEGIVYYPFNGQGYGDPIKVKGDFNKEVGMQRASHPCIDWEEEFLIFDKIDKNSYGGSDLYITFKTNEGTWGEAVNMGKKINSPGHDWGASLSPDGKNLFFHKNRDIYWVSTTIIQNLRK